jgi:hypothetical protein
MQPPDEDEGKHDRWVGIETLEGGGYGFISEFNDRDSKITKTSVSVAGNLARILKEKPQNLLGITN